MKKKKKKKQREKRSVCIVSSIGFVFIDTEESLNIYKTNFEYD